MESGKNIRLRAPLETMAQPTLHRRPVQRARLGQNKLVGGISGDEAEKGMAQMSAKFKEMGSSVYLDAEKVKESNRVL